MKINQKYSDILESYYLQTFQVTFILFSNKEYTMLWNRIYFI